MDIPNINLTGSNPAAHSSTDTTPPAQTTTPQKVRQREIIAFLGLLLIGFIALFPYRHFAGDDAYISFRFVQNLATGHGFAFNPDVPTYGSTAPLWVYLVAGVHKLGVDIPLAAHLLDALAAGGALALFWGLTGLAIRSVALRFVAGVLFLLDPWFIRWGMSGMENPLALLFLCGAVYFQWQQRGRARVDWRVPVFCGLGILTRPEFAVFTLLIFFDTLLFEREGRVKKLLVYALLIFLVVLPWLYYAKTNFGTVIPNTITAKVSAKRLDALIGSIKYLGSFYIFEIIGILLAVTMQFRRVRTALRSSETRARWFLPVAWIVALPLLYIVGGAPVAGRYLMLALPAYLLVGVKAWEVLLNLDFALHPPRALQIVFGCIGVGLVANFILFRLMTEGESGLQYGLAIFTDFRVLMAGISVCLLLCLGASLRRSSVLVGVLAFLSLVLIVGVQYQFCWYITKWPQGMDPRMIELGKWLRDNTQPDDLIACDQIGVIGYFSKRNVLDTVGLISPEMQAPNKLPDPKAIWRSIYARAPQYLMVLDDLARLRAIDPAYNSLEWVMQVRVQREGAGSVNTEAPYNLYRTHWDKTTSRVTTR